MKRSSSSVVDDELFDAVAKGSLRDLQVLVDQGADIHAFQLPCSTIMHVAAFYGHQHLLAFFLSKGLDVNAINEKYRHTPLHEAAGAGHAEVVQFLLDQNANIHAVDVLGQKPIHTAARAGQKGVIQIFLNKGLDVNAIDEKYRYTPLHEASGAGHAEVVQYLLDQNANMHAVDVSGQKPIHTAARAGQKGVVQIFLNKGMDVQETDWKGSTLLHLSCTEGKLEVVQFLVNYKADIHATDGNEQKPIHAAAENGHKNIVQFFLNRGMSVDEPDNDDCTLLHWACRSRWLSLVQFLVVNNADIHAKATYGRKPIHVAAVWGQKDVVEYFLDLGMSIEEADHNGQTLLHLAVEDLDVVQLLVNRIATTHAASSVQDIRANSLLDAQDNEGRTPLHLVTALGYEANIMNCLLDAGARSDIKDDDGRTVLYYFMSNYYYYDVSILAKMHNFVDIDAQTKLTAAHIVAVQHQDMDTIKLVLQHQKYLNIENKFAITPMNYLTKNLSLSNIDKQETFIRMFVDHGACFKVEDCERIVQNRYLKEKLFTDKKFCSQYLVNKFDNVDLPMLGKLPSAVTLLVLEKLKLKSGQIRVIDSAVEEEIRNKGHCDVSKMKPPLLSILAIEIYISHYHAS